MKEVTERHTADQQCGEWLTPAELADALRVPRSWVYSAVRTGRIPVMRVGRYLRFNLGAVIEALGDRQDKEASDD